jgi:4-amino-4-deoxy-L-arabinose transferase-like glycosyltransferase
VSPARAIPVALLVAIVVRAPFWIEALRTPVDGDTAIVGLMARHLGQGTTMWGQPYGSPLDAWVAAPFVALLGPKVEALRLPAFLLGLALVPLAYGVGRRVHPGAALPAALLMACPPPYLVLLSALPPPFYATTLALCGILLLLALQVRPLLDAGDRPLGRLALFGALSGLALWTHLMSASVVAACLLYLFWRSRRLGPVLAALLPLALTSAPFWTRAAAGESEATRIVGLRDQTQDFGQHLRALVPRLHEPLGALAGTHVPVIPDDAEHLVAPPRAAAVALVALDVLLLVVAVRHSRHRPGAMLLIATAALVAAAFVLPARSEPWTIRFLSPLALPALVLLVLPVADRPRRALVVVLALATLHLSGASRLLAEWRRTDRADAPFLLPDLGPVQAALLQNGSRHAYASYGPAYRLTWESGERIVASQPWNERFRHYPLPFLDEVRFAKNAAWVLTPKIPTDLPPPREFEKALGAIGGSFRRVEAGAAVVYLDFAPPYGPGVEPVPGAGPAGDLDPRTAVSPDPVEPTTFDLGSVRSLLGVTLVSGTDPVRLLRSMDVEVSDDGELWEVVAQRRRREERFDLRWVNGHPQYVIDHDLFAVPLEGREVRYVRVTPIASSDSWRLGEVLVHPAGAPPQPWDEWMRSGLTWSERRRALLDSPQPAREDWHWRVMLAARNTD